MEYRDAVLGFVFNETGSQVLLIEKNRPAGMEGKLNGLGGAVEPGESINAAILREIREEAGLDLPQDEVWKVLTYVTGDGLRLHCYTAFVGDHIFKAFSSPTDETVGQYLVGDLFKEEDFEDVPVVLDLHWLLPMARVTIGQSFFVQETPNGVFPDFVPQRESKAQESEAAAALL